MAEAKIENAEKTEKQTSSDITNKLRENPWIISTIVIGIFALVILFFLVKGGITGNVISESDIGEQAVTFVNTQLLQGQETVTLDSVSEKYGLYEVLVNYNGQKVPVYFTRDGEYYLGTQIVPTTLTALDSTPQVQTPAEIPKSDKPEVKLFVMSHCPYGVEAQKIFIPVMELLGNKADIRVHFVDYAMHGKQELDDNNIEYCLQKEQPQGFINFMKCFVDSEDSTQCLASVLGIDKNKLNACIYNLDKQYNITALYNDKSTWLSGSYPLYPVEGTLNDEYGVKGSENLIINGVSISPSQYRWDANELKQLVCSAFTTPPAECSQTVSSSGVTGAATAGSCG